MQGPGTPAPPWTTTDWFNTGGRALQLEDLRGRVVVLHAFQMPCPGCVQHGLGQTMRRYALEGPPSLLLIDRKGDLRAQA